MLVGDPLVHAGVEPRLVPGLDVGGAAGATHGAIAVPPVVHTARAPQEQSVGPQLERLVLVLQRRHVVGVGVEPLAVGRLLLRLAVELGAVRHLHQLRGGLGLVGDLRRPLHRRRDRLAALGPPEQRLEAAPLAGEDRLLDLSEVHSPIGLAHILQDPIDVGPSVPLRHGHRQQRADDALHGAAGLRHLLEEGLPTVVLDHLLEL
mmetsp:Transcript_31666/g.98572  ORF Transcript_31666/g.98572 Transcript_31666/m.98572 type:complete len:205 (+) Transcript_31666:162-776(+)